MIIVGHIDIEMQDLGLNPGKTAYMSRFTREGKTLEVETPIIACNVLGVVETRLRHETAQLRNWLGLNEQELSVKDF